MNALKTTKLVLAFSALLGLSNCSKQNDDLVSPDLATSSQDLSSTDQGNSALKLSGETSSQIPILPNGYGDFQNFTAVS